eukprot:CAMPEP_0201283202 /NCGR_PEP_ID=MMETSP1317-20130820/7910_1 /ASSEMBLY_ACC=CAM_ASM_000770 /TAXON_ID=187299 /ORGANISM="Undescribed Undescribed, Strain Undescribed" /LENGTH=35 /DNA_ID= /DNA_START= /DNA_END= /DNA_ORIENTATION=
MTDAFDTYTYKVEVTDSLSGDTCEATLEIRVDTVG